MALDLGGVRVSLLSGGALRLDGGAMFGIIPKALWSRRTPHDEQNRIQLACNCLLVEWNSGRAGIVETGHGAKYAPREREMFAIDAEHWLLPSLCAAGVDPLAISTVVVTHLHFDHAGGLTRPADDGGLLPTFPSAKVHVQRQEFEDARANFGIMTMTYREENYTPLDAAGAWALLDGEAEVAPGLHVLPSRGHTRGHQSVLIRGSEGCVLFPGDVLPTLGHAGAPYNMGYDLLPLDNRETKLRLLGRAADERWLIVIDHEPRTPVVRAARDGNWFVLSPVTDLDLAPAAH